MSFLVAAIIPLLNTSPADWSGFQWTIGFCAVVILYTAGVTASIFVEKMLRRQTKDASGLVRRYRSSQ